MGDTQTLRRTLEQLKGKHQQIEHSISKTTEHLAERKSFLQLHEQAREVIRVVGLKTQQQLEIHISDITSLALEAVFPNPYRLVVEFIQRRNKTECDLYFERGGNRINPLQASGGGPVDIASFALRAASQSMQFPKTRPVLILDEPFKHLSVDLLPKASEMLKQLSEDLGLQLIIVTHSEELVECSDKIFKVSLHKGVTTVE
jgi:DNA repair exonuclease SbcCD ATPase subunit